MTPSSLAIICGIVPSLVLEYGAHWHVVPLAIAAATLPTIPRSALMSFHRKAKPLLISFKHPSVGGRPPGTYLHRKQAE